MQKIKIVPPHPDYAELLFKWRHEDQSVKFNPLKPITLDEIRENFKKGHQAISPLDFSSAYRWFIEYEGILVGSVCLFELNPMMLTGEVGYSITETYYGKGITTAAMKIWVDMIFEQTNLRKLIASIAEGNIASHRVIEKVGFKKEGFLREHFLIQGQPVNEVIYGLLRSEWGL